MESRERKEKILAAVVDLYIRTGEPVGSKAVVERMDNAVSSATIRNEMAVLSAEGFLDQPHTSAGRVPTAKAFRLYIDQLMPRQALSEESRHDIDEKLRHSASDPDKLIEEASQTLAEATGCAAVTTTPEQLASVLKRIEVMRIGPRTVTLLLMTNTGLVRNRVCRFDGDVDDGTLERLLDILHREFLGKPLADVSLVQMQGLLVELGGCGLRCVPVLTAFVELVEEAAEADVSLSGQLNLLEQPDYEPENARSLLSFLSRREELASMLTAHPGGLRVVLGSESPRPELNGSSIIVTRYSLGDKNGTIGLIGPLRMDYASMIPRLEYIANTVSRILTELAEEDNDGK